MFAVNDQLLSEAAALLGPRPYLFWLVGSACSGKSTLCRALAATAGIDVIDMDALIYGEFMGRYSPERYPAASTYFSSENPLEWVLSLRWDDFNALNRATTAEYIHLLAQDLQDRDPAVPLLIDGGITHPGLATQIISPANIACLTLPDALRVDIWHTAADRAEMRGWIQSLPNPDTRWQTFLQFDQGIADTLVADSATANIAIFEREASTAVADLTARLVQHFQLPISTSHS